MVSVVYALFSCVVRSAFGFCPVSHINGLLALRGDPGRCLAVTLCFCYVRRTLWAHAVNPPRGFQFGLSHVDVAFQLANAQIAHIDLISRRNVGECHQPELLIRVLGICISLFDRETHFLQKKSRGCSIGAQEWLKFEPLKISNIVASFLRPCGWWIAWFHPLTFNTLPSHVAFDSPRFCCGSSSRIASWTFGARVSKRAHTVSHCSAYNSHLLLSDSCVLTGGSFIINTKQSTFTKVCSARGAIANTPCAPVGLARTWNFFARLLVASDDIRVPVSYLCDTTKVVYGNRVCA